MNKQRVFRGWSRQRLPLLAVALLLVGCATGTRIQTEPVGFGQFDEQLVLTTHAIKAGDLEQARAYLKEARGFASTPKQHTKVAGLDHLINGAEALMAGDPARARTEWARIDEPHLNREVRHKARLIGMDLPARSREDEATQ